MDVIEPNIKQMRPVRIRNDGLEEKKFNVKTA